jgi:hypothetical protein
LSPPPEFNPGYRFILYVENTVQEEIIKSVKPDLVGFLRTELENSSIEVLTEVKEKAGVKLIYSDDEKYQEMARKNPDLVLLREKFRLDFGD